jgi:signal peptidase I
MTDSASTSPVRRTPPKFVPPPVARTDPPAAESAAATPDEKPKGWRRVWYELRPIVVMLVVLFSFRSAVADYNVVPTGSMKPSIIEGDRIFVNKLAYDLKIPFTKIHVAQWSDPKRGDVVVFDRPSDGVRLVKRVVAIPGDTLLLRDNHLFINGQAATYDTLSADVQNQVQAAQRSGHSYYRESILGESHPVMFWPRIFNEKRNYGPLTVPPGQYFMMGDNRDNSEDSRFIGFIPRDNIVGRSSRVVVSLDYDDYYLPRAARWFRPLP